MFNFGEWYGPVWAFVTEHVSRIGSEAEPALAEQWWLAPQKGDESNFSIFGLIPFSSPLGSSVGYGLEPISATEAGGDFGNLLRQIRDLFTGVTAESTASDLNSRIAQMYQQVNGAGL